MAKTKLRRRKDKAYGVGPAGSDYLAVLAGGEGTVAALYKGGDLSEDLVETGDLTLDIDGRTHFAENRYLISSTPEAVEVWDIQENVAALYEVPEGWLNLGAASVNGAVYWIESATEWVPDGDDHETQMRLRSAAFDLATPSTVRTHTISSEFEWEWFDDSNDVPWFALNSTAALGQRRAVDPLNGEVAQTFRVRFLLGGSGSSDAATATIRFDPYVAIPDGNGGSFGRLESDESTLWRLPDDVDAPATEQWPAEAPWQMSTAQLSLNVAGTEVAAFGSGTIAEESVLMVTRSYSTGPYTTPLEQFAVNQHPELEQYPSAMFIRG